MCVSFYSLYPTLGEAVTAAKFGTSVVQYGLQNLWMGCIKQILTALILGVGRKLL